MNNLFITGNIRIGKSSLLRRCLVPYRDVLGGFSSQRILDGDGKIAGYRLADAKVFRVDCWAEPSLTDVFISFSGGRKVTDRSVFEGSSLEKLVPDESTKVMLLDEIGGIELTVPGFRAALYKILRSETPCIGVIKSFREFEADPRRLADRAEEYKLNSELRKFLEDDHGSTVIDLRDQGLLYEKGSREISSDLEKTITEALGSMI